MSARRLATVLVAPLLAAVLVCAGAAPAIARDTKRIDGFELTLKAVVSKPGSVTVKVELDGEIYRKLDLGERFGPQRRFRVAAITLPPCAAFDYKHARVRDTFGLCVD